MTSTVTSTITTTSTTTGIGIIGLTWDSKSDGAAPPGYLSENTNKGYGGRKNYVKPVYGPESHACTGFKFVRNEKDIYNSLPAHSTGDLAKGAGGDYRYIIPVFNAGPRVKSVYWTEVEIPSRCTGDVNKGRGGRDLFLCWSY